MKKVLAFVCAACFSASAVTAQSDPVAAAMERAEWKVDVVAPGVLVRSHHFDHLLGLPQFLSVLEVDMNAQGLSVDVVQTDSGRASTSSLASMIGAVAAVNGSYFERDGAPAVFLQDDGEVLRRDENRESRISEQGALATSHGDAVITRAHLPAWQMMSEFSDVLAAGPMLIWDGVVVESADVSFNLTHHPRTAAGVTADNTLLLVTADGRSTQSAGLTIPELALVMRSLGAQYALNLDGGGSTTMWVAGRGVVNHPSDNGQFDADGERTVANAVVVHVTR